MIQRENSKKNEFKVTEKLARIWTYEGMFSGVRLILFIVYSILFLFSTVAAVAFFILEMYIYTYIFALLAFMSLFSTFPKNLIACHKQYNLLSSTYGQNWTRTIEFNDECIQITEGTTVSKTNYSDIQNIKEKERKIWLVLKNKMKIRLYKDCFIDCSWEECKAYILSKTEQSDKSF